MTVSASNPDPYVHCGDGIRDGSVVALDIRGTDGYNAGLRVRAELTRDELADLVDALTRRLEYVDAPQPRRVTPRDPWDPAFTGAR